MAEPESPPEARSPRKQRTREALLEAALHLLKQGRSFNGLSLREVTREAGVVPTAFYRHFHSMDELGLALVEEGRSSPCAACCARRGATACPLQDIIRSSVLIYKRYVEDNRLQFRFVAGERSGGVPAIRDAIRREVSHFTNEMAQDLRALNAPCRACPPPRCKMICRPGGEHPCSTPPWTSSTCPPRPPPSWSASSWTTSCASYGWSSWGRGSGRRRRRQIAEAPRCDHCQYRLSLWERPPRSGG